ncbi:hypothetical protein HAX54_049280 [Datura stramonium]|uniref:Uncharacterized protein n=1 Tax=Datura stramonium TaxID=4076 RepID=A0ABS8WKB0_DATST|nr:hypothetical protein [Datura stramonium]
MWAAPPLIQRSSPCIHRTQFPTTNPAAMCLPVGFATMKPAANLLPAGVPRNFQLYSQLRKLDLGSVAEQNSMKSQRKHRKQGAEEKEGDSKEEENKLSGFDVLRALEKAAAQKRKKKNRNGRDSSLSSGKVTGQGRKGTPKDEAALADYGSKDVRSLSIKEDWGTRLDELETRLEELMETAAA